MDSGGVNLLVLEAVNKCRPNIGERGCGWNGVVCFKPVVILWSTLSIRLTISSSFLWPSVDSAVRAQRRVAVCLPSCEPRRLCDVRTTFQVINFKSRPGKLCLNPRQKHLKGKQANENTKAPVAGVSRLQTVPGDRLQTDRRSLCNTVKRLSAVETGFKRKALLTCSVDDTIITSTPAPSHDLYRHFLMRG